MNKFLIFSFLFLVACGDSGPSALALLKIHKKDAELKFEKFYACYDIALITPKIQEDKIDWIPGVDPTAVLENNNCYQIGIESFKDLSEPLDVPFDGTRRREHVDMAQLFEIDLSDHKQAHSYNLDWKYSYNNATELPDIACKFAIKHFIDSRYLLINRVVDKKSAGLNSETTYSEGFAKGDVLVFDIEAEKLIGGFKVDARSDNQISMGEYDDVYSNLNADLDMNIYDMIKRRFKEMSPVMSKVEGITF
jgi:hypothetical protein